MKSRNFTITCLVLLISFILFQTCAKDDLGREQNFLEEEQTSQESTSVIEKIKAMGYDVKDIVEFRDFYIVEGDVAFPKNVKDFKAGRRASSSFGTYRYDANNLFPLTGTSQFIDVYSYISTTTIGDPWFDAINQSISDWNSGSSCINMRLVNDPNGADIYIKDMFPNGDGGGSSLYGFADNFVTSHHADIYINLQFDSGNTAVNEKRNIISRGLGHTIGFLRNDLRTPATPSMLGLSDVNSIMTAGIVDRDDAIIGLTATDHQLRDHLYSSTNDCGLARMTGTINGPKGICVNARPTTCTWSGSGVIDEWRGSSNLNLSNETGTSVDVSATSEGTATLEALQNGSVVGTLSIRVSGRPVPDNIYSTVITGPDTLYTNLFNARLYRLSDPNFRNAVTSVEWVVFSYVYEGADRFIQIQSPYAGEQYWAMLTAVTGTPKGLYTVQCRVSNSCGTYTFDKEFFVDNTRIIALEF
ncbi:MAG: M57 family metalloprotease [Bacteroidota bacterium]